MICLAAARDFKAFQAATQNSVCSVSKATPMVSGGAPAPPDTPPVVPDPELPPHADTAGANASASQASPLRRRRVIAEGDLIVTSITVQSGSSRPVRALSYAANTRAMVFRLSAPVVSPRAVGLEARASRSVEHATMLACTSA